MPFPLFLGIAIHEPVGLEPGNNCLVVIRQSDHAALNNVVHHGLLVIANRSSCFHFDSGG